MQLLLAAHAEGLVVGMQSIICTRDRAKYFEFTKIMGATSNVFLWLPC